MNTTSDKPVWYQNKIEYDKKYQREMTKKVAFTLYKTRDEHLIEIYESIPDKAAWFRECLEEYERKNTKGQN